jgi:hypothetical protein
MKQTDTIPRINDIEYFFAGLQAFRSRECTFDEIRRTLLGLGMRTAQEELGIARTGYTVSRRLRFTDAYTYWTNARDVLRELMTLGFVKPNTVPSRRKYVERHRDTCYEITDKGYTLRESMTQEDDSTFRDMFFQSFYYAHPYVRAFLKKLAEREIHIPIYKLQKGRRTTREITVNDIISDSTRWLSQQENDGTHVTTYSDYLKQYLSTKIPQRTTVDNKTVLRIVNEGVRRCFLRTCGFDFDIITFDQLVRICTQFWVTNYAYNIPSIDGLVVYSTAEILDMGNKLDIKRHRLSDYVTDIVDEIRSQFSATGKSFVPIHELRAAVCFRLRINDEVFDAVVTDIYKGKVTTNYTLTLLTDLPRILPPSASPLQIGEKSFYTLTLMPEEDRR